MAERVIAGIEVVHRDYLSLDGLVTTTHPEARRVERIEGDLCLLDEAGDKVAGYAPGHWRAWHTLYAVTRSVVGDALADVVPLPRTTPFGA